LTMKNITWEVKGLTTARGYKELGWRVRMCNNSRETVDVVYPRDPFLWLDYNFIPSPNKVSTVASKNGLRETTLIVSLNFC
jgi:hypothetical protein